MPLIDSLQVLRSGRSDEVVVTMMSVAREWMALGSHPLDFVYAPSSMGQASSIGLGIALARPDKRVIACNGDGSTLMNLGSLVTITSQSPKNLTLLIFDNGVYEVTGSQATPGAAVARQDESDIDFAAVARACGFRSVFEFDALDQWQAEVGHVISSDGPTCVVLKVAAESEGTAPKPSAPGAQRAIDFTAALESS
jgi:thiamine pyrophosphate-dependent acetolactate synthase large subunit-like protein